MSTETTKQSAPSKSIKGIIVPKPGNPIALSYLLLDYNGTLAVDGALIEGVSAKLIQLAQQIEITVITADTFGTAAARLKSLPVTLRIVSNSEDKKRFTASLGAGGLAAIGNGNNDVEMFRLAKISIAVMGPEGTSSELLRVASLVVTDIHVALDLLLNPQRLVATLRE